MANKQLYTPKTEKQRAWNKVRRQVAAHINTELSNLREDYQEEAFARLYPQFEDAFTSGKILTFKFDFKDWLNSDPVKELGK